MISTPTRLLNTYNPGSSTGCPCPNCGTRKSSTIDSRPDEKGHVRRRKECTNCANRFTTYETLIPPDERYLSPADQGRLTIAINALNKIKTGIQKPNKKVTK